jgi:hypothetical protein
VHTDEVGRCFGAVPDEHKMELYLMSSRSNEEAVTRATTFK